MIIAPVIFLTVATGIAGMNGPEEGGPRGRQGDDLLPRTFSTLALAIVGHAWSPTPCSRARACTSIPPRWTPRPWRPTPSKAHESDHHRLPDEHHPDRPSSAPSRSGDILQVLFFSVLFGIALGMVGEQGKPVVDFLQALM
jgi:aerobic C4-dicarboxylate transport protein